MTAIDWAGVVALSITVTAVAAIAVIEALVRLLRLPERRRLAHARWAVRITGPHGERYWLRTEGRREEYGSVESALRAGAAYRYHLGACGDDYVVEVVDVADMPSHMQDVHPLDREAVGA